MPSWHDGDVLGLVSSSSAFAGLWLQARDSPVVESPWMADDEHGLTSNQLLALRLTSLVMGAISLMSSLFATFWFARMSRSFRHDLIILLIHGDTLKSVVFIILPAIELVRGPVASVSGTCQASGFFLTVGFEACDVAVVLIALHTALYIFRGRSGLYPFRRLALSLFLVVPLLLGSLAFLNKPAFTNSGRYCHLPSRPRWASLALSWIPRYVILVTICITYISTYVHVHVLMNRFGAACQGDRLPGPQPAASDGDGVVSAPPTPPVTPSPPPPEGPDPLAGRSRGFPAASMAADGHTMARRRRSRDQEDRRALVSEALDEAVRPAADSFFPVYRQGRCALSNLELATTVRCPADAEAASHDRRSAPFDASGRLTPAWPWTHPTRTTTIRNSWSRPLLATAPAKMSSPPPAMPSPTQPSRLHTMLRRGPCDPDPSAMMSPCQLQLTLGTPPGMNKVRDKIRRQLRQLFIYPTVYIFVWVIPFVSHVTGGTSWNRPSFALALASLASLCAQGIADALVFSILEKPWRHPRNVAGGSSAASWWRGGGGGGGQAQARDCGRKGSSGFMPCWPVLSTVDGHLSGGAGRTRDEMLVDSRAARFRRDEELAERRMMRRAEPCAAEASRDWWDVRLGRLDGWGDDDYDDEDVGCDAKGSGAAVATNQKRVSRFSL